MADKRAQRQQKKRSKQKKSREAAQGKRRGRSTKGVGGISSAADWPVGECFAGANWHEKGAQLHVAFSRVHQSGRTAVAVFQLDLAERGVVLANTALVPDDQNAMAFIAQHTEGDDPVLESTPELVVKLVRAAAAHGQSQGHSQPGDLSQALELMVGVDASTCEHDILVGPPAPAKANKASLFSWIFGRYWN